MLIGAARASARSKTVKVWPEEDNLSILERRFSTWIDGVAETEEKYFKKYVYENPDITDMDLRQHRAGLYLILSTGEELAVDFLGFNKEAGQATPPIPLIQKYILLIDQKLDELRQTLHQWHGDLESQTDIPESFKQAVRDFETGKVVDMETALKGAPQHVAKA